MNTSDQRSDARILEDSQRYPWAFEVLVERYQEAFLRKGVHMLRSKADAEDAVQETFLRIYKYANRFSERENASFKSWAYKILVNTCNTHLSKKIKTSNKTTSLEFADLDAITSVDIETSKDISSVSEAILARLPANLARLLRLYFFEDKSYEEIALIEDLSLSAVRSGLHRARKQFKKFGMEITQIT